VKLKLKSCPKCNGDVMVDRDEHGWYEHCMQCGHMRDIESLIKSHEQHCEREKPEPGPMGKQTTEVSIFSYQPLPQEGILHSFYESPVEAHEQKCEREKPELGPMRKQTTKVSIFSYQPLLQEGILHSLSRTEDIQVISQTKATDKEPIVKTVPPDIAIVDVDGPSDSGSSLVRRLKQHFPSVSIIVLTSHPSDDQLFQALENRVAAYLSKEINGDQLANMVRRAAHGEYPMNESLSSRPQLAGKILNQFQELSGKTEVETLIAPLTARETEILNYVAQGYSNKQIAAELTISEQTIKNHIASIMVKLNARARTQAVVIAAQQGFISIECRGLR